MSCVKLMSDNYVSLDILANTDVSSEQTAFPVTNAYNVNRRSKVWRSNGHYQVTSSNNTLIFRETVGVDLTATLTVGDYATTALFMAEVKAALEAAGVATYTITQNAYLKFNISSNLGGGATVFQPRFADASTTCEDLLGFASTNLSGASNYTADYVRINSDEWILWDMGLSTNPKNFILIGARNRSIKISPSATIKLQGNITNNFTTPLYDTTLTYNDEAIVKLSDTGLHTTGLRYWRVQIIDRENPYGYVEVGAFFLGDHFIPERGAVQFPFVSQFEDMSENIVSEGGQSFTEIREQSQSYNLNWSALTKADIEEITRIFRKYGTAKPFFIVFDDAQVFSTETERMTKFVKFVKEPSYQLESPNNFNCSMQLKEEL